MPRSKGHARVYLAGGVTPLIFAVERGELPGAGYFLDRGADPNVI
jgi:hypothetical protein